MVPRSSPGAATPPNLPRSASSFSRFDNGRGNGGSAYASRTGSGVGTPVEEVRSALLRFETLSIARW